MPLVELSVYVEADELEAIRRNAQDFGGSRSEYIRTQIQECEP